MKRYRTNKKRSASKFRHNVQRTKLTNIAPPPMRGGYRL